MMKRAEVHVVDLIDAATVKPNPALRSHALELEAADDGLVVSNRGGFHSSQTPSKNYPTADARRRRE